MVSFRTVPSHSGGCNTVSGREKDGGRERMERVWRDEKRREEKGSGRINPI